MFEKIYDFSNLHRAYTLASRGKKHRREVLKFEQNLEENLIDIQNRLIWGMYKPGPYKTFEVYEPKKRQIACLPFYDRVVQHAVNNIIEPVFEKVFIFDSYACRKGKGTHAGALRAQRFIKDAGRQETNVYILKCDIEKYFNTINRDILYDLLKRKLKCRRTLELLKIILDSSEDICLHCGIPLGNLTSQLFANIYLNHLDMLLKHEYRVKMYIRYMDDFIIVHNNKKYLNGLLSEIKEFLEIELRLNLNSKTKIFKTTRTGEPLNFLGYRIWSDHMKLRRGFIVKTEKEIKKINKRMINNPGYKIAAERKIASWKGHAGFCNSHLTMKRILSKVQI